MLAGFVSVRDTSVQKRGGGGAVESSTLKTLIKTACDHYHILAGAALIYWPPNRRNHQNVLVSKDMN